MPTKERYQNPVVGDTLRLRLFFYNSNNFADVNQIQEVKIYKVADGASMNDVSARTLVQTVTSASIVNSDTGQYYIDIEVSESVSKID